MRRESPPRRRRPCLPDPLPSPLGAPHRCGNGPWAAAVDIQRVIERELPFELLMVADLHVLEAASNGVEPSGLGREVLRGGVCPAHDQGRAVQGRVIPFKPVLAQQGVEATEGPWWPSSTPATSYGTAPYRTASTRTRSAGT